MRRHATLGQNERAQVYYDADSGRVLGFGPDGARPMFPLGTRYRTETLFHASAIERAAQRYRSQSLRDAEEDTLRILEREAPIRKAIRDAVIERNNHVDERNKALNNAMLKVMDFYYEKARSRRLQVEVAIAAERYEAGKSSIDVALESSYLKEEKRG